VQKRLVPTGPNPLHHWERGVDRHALSTCMYGSRPRSFSWQPRLAADYIRIPWWVAHIVLLCCVDQSSFASGILRSWRGWWVRKQISLVNWCGQSHAHIHWTWCVHVCNLNLSQSFKALKGKREMIMISS
jgi:hypothetical protein